jgi:hypothetical protein
MTNSAPDTQIPRPWYKETARARTISFKVSGIGHTC